MPTPANISPASVISNIPNGAMPCCCATPSTMMLVDVPISVVVPPKIAAKERGISSFEGEILIARARRIATGMRMITTGVLLIKAESSTTPSISAITASVGEPF